MPAGEPGREQSGKLRYLMDIDAIVAQVAATIGTGSSAIRLTSRTATGSLRAMARRTSLTPARPSASPTASATSAITESMSTGVMSAIMLRAAGDRPAARSG